MRPALDGVACPACGGTETGVVDTRKKRTLAFARTAGGRRAIDTVVRERERRRCAGCRHRWTIAREAWA